MYQTTYHRASSIDEAAALFAKGTEAKYLAGGQTLLPVMKQRLAAPSEVIDLARIKDLVGVELSGDTLTIKAATTYYDIMSNADVKKAIPAIAHLTSVLGDPAVRYRGTIGGSIANNDPAADYPAAVLALGATVKTNKRAIAAEDFFQGPVHDGAGGRRDHHTSRVPDSGQGRLFENAPSGLALRADRRVRGQDQSRRCSRRRHRRVAERRDAGARDRGGAARPTGRRRHSMASISPATGCCQISMDRRPIAPISSR